MVSSKIIGTSVLNREILSSKPMRPLDFFPEGNRPKLTDSHQVNCSASISALYQPVVEPW